LQINYQKRKKKLKDEIATVKEQLAQKIAESVKQSKEHQDLKYTKEKEGKETKEHVSVLEETIAEKSKILHGLRNTNKELEEQLAEQKKNVIMKILLKNKEKLKICKRN